MPVGERRPKRPVAASQRRVTGNKRSRRAQSVSPPSRPTSSTESDDTLEWLSDSSAASPREPLSSSFPSSSSHSSPASASTSTPASDSTRLFDPDECQPSRLPIFRDRDSVARSPVEQKTPEQLQQLTFSQWLSYYLGAPEFCVQRRYLFSDEQYCTLLGYLTAVT